ncbi:hypothetical protein [Azospirillum sp.]|uniref:hypothetical protein n=1 Tax=Azospirillum sp. TaxID=34012 RepID=UPI003D74D154
MRKHDADRLQAAANLIGTTYTAVCDELGCAYGGEAPLNAIRALKDENARLREAATTYLRADTSDHEAMFIAEGKLREALGLV